MTELDLAPAAPVVSTRTWAVAHDFVFQNGGAEAVTRWICHDSLPDARLLYLAGDAQLAATLAPGGVQQLLPASVTERTFRRYAPVIPAMLRRLPPLQLDLLVSSYAFAGGIRTEGRKVIYCHSPLRQAWSGAKDYRRSGPVAERIAARALGPYFRRSDRRAADSADTIVATSRAVRDRIAQYYGRTAEIVAPPVDDATFSYDPLVDREGFYVWAGRITEPYKRLGIVLDAFRDLPHLQLVIVGDGRDRARLERTAPPNARFLGWRRRSDLAALYRQARAVVFPSEDDFGLVAAESLISGTPVVAFGRGGALDTVRDGENGVLFHEQTSAAVTSALRRFERQTWSPAAIAGDAAGRYGRAQFSARLQALLAKSAR